jgi:hypothetical protein
MQRTTNGIRSSRRRDVEVAAVGLIRSVLEPEWSAASAGAALRTSVHGDRNVLLVLRARAIRELSRGWTPLGQRAAATVDAALALEPAEVEDRVSGSAALVGAVPVGAVA